MKKLKLIFSLFTFALVIAFTGLNAQNQQKGDVYVDDSGIMRWGHNNEEVHGFGVNYSAPFAHAYRSAEKKGLDIKAEMDRDIYHFTRLNFDLYRLHVWDTEISDEKGNLIENEHLDAFDYLLNELKKRNINFVITPIAYWGNGWPEPDEDTQGFSNKYGKENSLTDPEAIKAQENYLSQFLEHVNPYTGVAYKNEPNLIAFEVSNEPHHRGTPQDVKSFINKMVKAMKSTGTKKPIFYNVSHSVHLADTYFTSEIDGGTFQWYPTGLGFQQELEGNLLPNVNDYKIPFEDVIEENNKAKLVYEFDAADVNKSYMYPAIARSIREAGIQLATHFAYDPSFLAYANTEYNTHYMNLNYTPHKALALMIVSEIFHRVSMNKDLGVYPENLEFGDFKISYKGDVATYNSGEKFIYTNSNEIEPKQVSRLKQIAGLGNSEIVKYAGKGAYFLDKLEDGVWRLEVMPDPILIRNPFGSNSLDKTVSVISWKENKIELDLKDLAENFKVSGLNEGNNASFQVEGKQFEISPGTYLLNAQGKEFDISTYDNDKNYELEAFEAQKSTVDKTYLVHEPVTTSTEGTPIKIKATLVSKDPVTKVEAWLENGNNYESLELKADNNYDYSAEVPENLLKNGFLKYRIIVSTSDGKITFPGGVEGSPADWDFHSQEKFETAILEKGAPVYLFNAATDSEKVVRQWNKANNVVPVGSNEAEFQVRLDKLFEKDIENLDADPIYDYSFRYNFSENLGARSISAKDKLIIEARSLIDSPEKIQVALVMSNGAAFGKTVELTDEVKEIEIDIKDLKPVRTVTLPRPYPGFLPYYFDHSYQGELKLEEVEAIQFSIGPGIEEGELQQPHGVGIRSVRIQ
ncbi:cellulase (glycosyl hydrolase family 5) [Christiangramia gaetbulicola]|uniref:Cellulase (Glycosyl hydrolase family 5) n=1 Tax=Christiangramia gaetbulicola TaxID=703340 RepID=A0A2T6AF99_9FLAO|nr:cellulase family glycosylhydrolase [Christiangramia gaetbulicola]PTX42495.1 cellulase (glycosyl hydrolase family 5) [Christiangramia gaetbulicola]